MDAGKRLINDLFNGNRTIRIPFFQRTYVWQEPQWERFLADMETVSTQKQPHFLGAVMLKTHAHTQGDVRDLIDGQQRFTTLNIFFKVLYLKLNRNDSFNRLFRLDNPNQSLALQHNHNDINAFEKILGFTEEQALNPHANNIFAAYEYFRKNIDLDKIDAQAIKDHIQFVGIDLGEHDDEQHIFDTINTLSVRLSTAELLKSFFFDNQSDIGKFQQYWQPVFEGEAHARFWDYALTLGNTSRAIIDIFFHAYLQIQLQHRDLPISASDKQALGRMSHLFQSYKKLIQNYQMDKSKILAEIHAYARLFRQHFDFTCSQVVPPQNGMQRINTLIFGLKLNGLMPYILYILKNQPDSEMRDDLFGAIEAYVLRRIIVRAPNNHLNTLFLKMINQEVLSRAQFLAQLHTQENSVHTLPNQHDIAHAMRHTAPLPLHAKGILYLLESKIRAENPQNTPLLSFQKYHIEHLMSPKHKNGTWGNLTLLPQALNPQIRQANWQTKKHGNQKNSGLQHYAAGLATLTPYLALPEWGEPQIAQRADDLVREVLQIWAL